MNKYSLSNNRLQNADFSQQLDSKIASYSLVQQENICQTGLCNAIVTNSDSTIMLAGYGQQIRVYQFCLGHLQEIQSLCEHKCCVEALYFMRQSNQFISGSHDKIIIWAKVNDKWQLDQFLQYPPNETIRCIIMNKSENLRILCYFRMIYFWMKKDLWELQQQITAKNHNQILSICLNDSDTQLASCGNLIRLFQRNKQMKWVKKQNICLENCGRRICFLQDNMLAFQGKENNSIDILELNPQNQMFVRTQEIKFENSYFNCYFLRFHMIYNQKQSNILCQNGLGVILIEKTKSNFIMRPFIKFGATQFYACFTDDGQFLISWDQPSKNLRQILQKSDFLKYLLADYQYTNFSFSKINYRKSRGQPSRVLFRAILILSLRKIFKTDFFSQNNLPFIAVKKQNTGVNFYFSFKNIKHTIAVKSNAVLTIEEIFLNY